jgi:O-antigen ligase
MRPETRRLASVLDKATWIAWVLLLLTLPVTSFPHFPAFLRLGDTLVRPLALYPLGFLLLVDVVPAVLAGWRPPRVFWPALGFAVVAGLVTALSLLEPSLPFRAQEPVGRALRAGATLAVGFAFFLVTLRMTSTRERLTASIRWLLAGMAVATAWGLVQGSRLLFRWPYYIHLNAFQRLISIRDLFMDRISGLTYEPSWFADQLLGLALPFLIAAPLTGYRLFSRRWPGRLIEWGFLVAAVLALLLTYSRGGLITFGVAIAVSAVVLAGERLRDVGHWLGFDRKRVSSTPRGWLRPLGRLGLVLVAVAGLVWAIGWSGSRNPYFALLWTRIDLLRDPTAYLLLVGAGTRLALLSASWSIFLQHPWLGVGLGQSGFYLLDHLPGWAYARIEEITLLLAPTSNLIPNPKNLWARLLAETGIIGTVLFAVFVLLVLLAALALMRKREALPRYLGTAGMMSWLAVVVQGFSLDSFALPTMWVSFGIVGSAAVLFLDRRPTAPPSRAVSC